MKPEDDNKKGEEEMKRSSGPFVSMFMSRGVEAGNGETVVLRARLRARGGGDSSHAASGFVGRGDVVTGSKSSCNSQRAADVGREEHADSELLHLGVEVVRVVVRVVDLKRGERSVSGERWARCERLVWALRWTQLVRTTAGEVGVCNGGRREEWQENRFRDWQCARAVMEGNEESASAPASVVVSERRNNTVLLFAAGRHGKVRAPICMSCLDDCHPWVLLVKTVPLFVVCFSHRLLSTRSPASSSHTRSSTSARHCLLRLEASARRLAGGSQSAGPSNVDHDEAETPFQIFEPERAVALTDELLVMFASRRLVARAHADSGPCCFSAAWKQVCKGPTFSCRIRESWWCVHTTTFGTRR